MVNTNVHCRSCMSIRNIWGWTLVSKVEVSASIYGGISTPLVPQQLTWWFKVHLRRKAHASRAMLISKLECWFAKFNVELSLIKLRSKVLKIALRTAKLNVDLSQAKCYTLKLNVVIYFDFWRDGTPWEKAFIIFNFNYNFVFFNSA